MSLIITLAAIAVGAAIGTATFSSLKKRNNATKNTPMLAGMASGVGSAVLIYLMWPLLLVMGVAAGGATYYLKKKNQKALPPGRD